MKRYFKFLVIVFSLALLVFSFHSVLAQMGPPAPMVKSMMVIPPRLQLSGEPGTMVREVIKFRNDSDAAQAIKVTIKDFIVEGTEGTPVFVEEEVSGRWSLASWLTVRPSRAFVPPKETKSFTLTANIPLDALPGGHYAAVIYEPAAIGQVGRTGEGVQTGASAVATEVGTLVYLTVAGPIKEQAFVRRFEAPKFSEYGPIPFTTELVNRSDVHLRPKGVINIKNMLGHDAARLKLEERNIFPGASAIYENVWDKKWLFGRYKAILTAAYGAKGQVLTATIFFWVFPWKAITVSLLAVAIFVLFLDLLRRQLKKRGELEKKVKELEEKLESKS